MKGVGLSCPTFGGKIQDAAYFNISYNHVYLIPTGSPIRDHISNALLRMKEDGEIVELYNKWWDRRRCGKYEEEQAKFDKKKELPFKAYAVNPRDMAVAFLLLMVGVIGAVVFLVIENIVSRMRTTVRTPIVRDPIVKQSSL